MRWVESWADPDSLVMQVINQWMRWLMELIMRMLQGGQLDTHAQHGGSARGGCCNRKNTTTQEAGKQSSGQTSKQQTNTRLHGALLLWWRAVPAIGEAIGRLPARNLPPSTETCGVRGTHPLWLKMPTLDKKPSPSSQARLKPGWLSKARPSQARLDWQRLDWLG